jgi:hypothetical protein
MGRLLVHPRYSERFKFAARSPEGPIAFPRSTRKAIHASRVTSSLKYVVA